MCRIVFLPLWLFHAVVARGRFSLPAPSVPHDRHVCPYFSSYFWNNIDHTNSASLVEVELQLQVYMLSMHHDSLYIFLCLFISFCLKSVGSGHHVMLLLLRRCLLHLNCFSVHILRAQMVRKKNPPITFTTIKKLNLTYLLFPCLLSSLQTLALLFCRRDKFLPLCS